MKWSNFKRWFNHDFWRAFKKITFPIVIPATASAREEAVRKVYKSIKSARYAPSIPEAELVMNKGYGVARTIPVFCIEDYIVYYFCIKELEDVLCGNRTANTFGGWTLGGKLRSQEAMEIESEATDYGRYSFNPDAWKHVFGEFNALLYAQLDRDNHPFVLQFDLSNFYDCVRLDILQRWIREEAPADKGWVITLLFYFLNQWNRRNTGLHPQTVGIPQDALADCSRILANYYLQKYDHFAATLCSKVGAVYFRYADDQMILLKTTKNIEGLMLLLTRKLDRFGLRVNQKKVMLWSKEELLEHRCQRIHAIFAERGDNQDASLVSRFTKAYLAISNRRLKASWNGGLPLLNRLLWANLESLSRREYNKLVSRYTSKAYLLRANHRELVRISKLNQKCDSPVAFRRRLYALGNSCVHNGFHFETLTYARNIKSPMLVRHFKNRLRAIEEQMTDNEVH